MYLAPSIVSIIDVLIMIHSTNLNIYYWKYKVKIKTIHD